MLFRPPLPGNLCLHRTGSAELDQDLLPRQENVPWLLSVLRTLLLLKLCDHEVISCNLCEMRTHTLHFSSRLSEFRCISCYPTPTLWLLTITLMWFILHTSSVVSPFPCCCFLFCWVRTNKGVCWLIGQPSLLADLLFWSIFLWKD